jgi:hypothetical protein
VKFDGKKQLFAMLSAKLEKIMFDRPIDPKICKTGWLSLKEQMKWSVRSVLLSSTNLYTTTPTEQWFL